MEGKGQRESVGSILEKGVGDLTRWGGWIWCGSDPSCSASSSCLDHVSICLCELSVMILGLGSGGGGDDSDHDINDFKSSLPVSGPLSIFCLFQMPRICSVGLYVQMEVAIESCTSFIN